MTDDTALSDAEAATMAALEGMSVWEMIGELLALAARSVQWQIQRRLGGPGAVRRLLSILAAFLTVVMTMAVRQRAAIVHHLPVSASPILRHLRCPPSRWAGA
ncbi:hypothetical protein [Sphingomonas jeddahensis]|uniref:hypothetical protein n=1 Tax=Sphingomonas jeddahensis TaxID=1915074 RepID=UPI000976AF10|nr:hypothetical protein [Sphingomonas jeddahensis]